jgi:hypothetical protein
MTDRQLETKLIDASRGTRFERRAEAIIRAVWDIDDGRSAADVIALLHD